ncbi:MAG: polar amino acid transport system substrate-binding protein [Moritella dasanensis]|jgi:polar amino acid transport system substrate-binding protein
MPPLLRSIIKLCVFCYLYSMAAYSYSSSVINVSSALINISSSAITVTSAVNSAVNSAVSSAVNNISNPVINVGSYHCPPFVMSVHPNGSPQSTSSGLSILL